MEIPSDDDSIFKTQTAKSDSSTEENILDREIDEVDVGDITGKGDEFVCQPAAQANSNSNLDSAKNVNKISSDKVYKPVVEDISMSDE